MSYRVSGRTVDTAATADNVGAQLWNASTTKDIWVTEVHWVQIGATASNPGIVRTTARGTASTTVTPDIDNDEAFAVAPVSGALLDVAFSGQPTVSGPYIARINTAAAAGVGYIWVFPGRGIRVGQTDGLAVATPVATILQDSDVTFVWDE